MKTALIIVDVQRDFCEGGSLPVPGGDHVAQKIADLVITQSDFGNPYDVVVTTRDFHYPDDDNGGHFSANPDYKDTWPAHCVRGTVGAEFHPAIQALVDRGFVDSQFVKGLGEPAYSGFQGHNSNHESLNDYLDARNVLNVDVVGIAGDYCVKATALDAIDLGYDVVIREELVASVGGLEATLATCREVFELQL